MLQGRVERTVFTQLNLKEMTPDIRKLQLGRKVAKTAKLNSQTSAVFFANFENGVLKKCYLVMKVTCF
jgi:hypothetical protein